MSGVTVERGEIVYRLDADAARELSYILERESMPLRPGWMRDAGWADDAADLFAAADELEAAEKSRGEASERLDALIGDFIVRMVRPDWPRHEGGR